MDEKRKDQVRALVGRAVDTALVPFHAAVSKPAQKAYLGTAFFALTSLFLLCVSSAAFWIFYFSYIPQVGIDIVIYLQFGDGNPFGTTTLSSSLASQQPYDISLFLHLPHTPSNVAAGNFMVDLALLAPASGGREKITPDSIVSSSLSTRNTSSTILARSRRPAILTYTSTLVNTAHTLTTLPWYVLGWRKESEILHIPMFEGVEFAKARSSVPDGVKVTIEPAPEAKMQFYEAGVRIVARFGGLRWILYHHKLLSFFIFTGLFWSSSMLSMLLVWVGLTLYLSSSSDPPSSPFSPISSVFRGKSDQIKKEAASSSLPLQQQEGEGSVGPIGTIKSEPTDSDTAVPFDPHNLDDLSDTSRTFPTLGRATGMQQPYVRQQQPPLHFSSEQSHTAAAEKERKRLGKEGKDGDLEWKKRIKSEPGEEEAGASYSSIISPLSAGLGAGAEADDEDEGDLDGDGDGVGSEWRDSGIGTSREDERERDRREEVLRRRRKGGSSSSMGGNGR